MRKQPVIVSFKSDKLEQLWKTGNTTLLSSLYVYEVVDILGDLDAAVVITDLELLGYIIPQYKEQNWAVTITVNNVEPVGSVTCHYFESNAHDVDLFEFD